MSDVEESTAMRVQDRSKTTGQNILQRRPADHAEAFEPSSTIPSMLLTMFCSAALQSGAAESLQSINQPTNQYLLNQSVGDVEGDSFSADTSRSGDQGQILSLPSSTCQYLEHALDCARIDGSLKNLEGSYLSVQHK